MNNVLRYDNHIEIRPVSVDEIDIYTKWMISGEWRYFDAPWEEFRESWQLDELQKYQENFVKQVAKQLDNVTKCTIYYQNRPIGWVNAYRFSYDATSVKIGICICEDNLLTKGIGTICLKLWIDYWFVDRNMHRIGLDTWSLNKRMLRVAEKCGFRQEGIEREVHLWQNKRQSLHHFGMLKSEYIRV